MDKAQDYVLSERSNRNIKDNFFSKKPDNIAINKKGEWSYGDTAMFLDGDSHVFPLEPRLEVELENTGNVVQGVPEKVVTLAAGKAEFNEKWIVQQMQDYACGPTCVAMLLIDAGMKDRGVLKEIIAVSGKMNSDQELIEHFNEIKSRNEEQLGDYSLEGTVSTEAFKTSLRFWEFPAIVNDGGHYFIIDGPWEEYEKPEGDHSDGDRHYVVRDPAPGWQIAVKKKDLEKYIMKGAKEGVTRNDREYFQVLRLRKA
jgi:hypothetical protein